MLFRTHLVIAVAAILIFIQTVHEKSLFIVVVLAASILPDIDSVNSKLGKHKIFRPLQWVTRHRGMWHSLSFAIVIAITLSLFGSAYGFAFFLGYSLHLIADSFTQDGIRPFWPAKREINGGIHTGGRMEKIIFYGIIILNVILAISLVTRFF